MSKADNGANGDSELGTDDELEVVSPSKKTVGSEVEESGKLQHLGQLVLGSMLIC
jgi:hypothetical protein